MAAPMAVASSDEVASPSRHSASRPPKSMRATRRMKAKARPRPSMETAQLPSSAPRSMRMRPVPLAQSLAPRPPSPGCSCVTAMAALWAAMRAAMPRRA